jgi:hypothetical protein
MAIYGFDNKSKKYILFNSIEDIPGCTSSTYLRTAVQKMPVNSALITFQNDSKYPYPGFGILEVVKGYYDRANFTFSTSYGTYICHFLANDADDWTKTSIVWEKIKTDMTDTYETITKKITVSAGGTESEMLKNGLDDDTIFYTEEMPDIDGTYKPFITNYHLANGALDVYLYNPYSKSYTITIKVKILK